MNKGTQSTSKFDDWSELKEADCNSCASYWDDTCEGVLQGSQRRCTAFKAVRSITIPKRLEELENRVKWLAVCNVLHCIATLIALGLINRLLG